MRAPEFWSGQAEGRDQALALQALLAPIAWVYGAAVAARLRSAALHRVGAPVVCVGNLTLGGAGKTPVTRAVRALLGADAHVLLRGYGGRMAGPLRVTPEMDAHDVGDEALLHARDGETWIARDRAAGAGAAIAAGARAIVLDDGFQNPALAKDLSLVVIDGDTGFGNSKIFPAGPLRESVAAGLARANAVILMSGNGARAETSALSSFHGPILRAHLAPTAVPPAGPLIAFAGIGRPERFFATLQARGGAIAEAVPYADHHPYSAADLAWLKTLARERGARLITTEKDFARLPADVRAEIATLPVTAQFDDENALAALLAPIAKRMAR
jgi:tetraacyldisaccharide 4'-kinase